VSFDLAVFALDGDVDVDAVRAMQERCWRITHVEGDLDARIVSFYEALHTAFPNHPPYPADSPWTVMPMHEIGRAHV